MGWIRDITGKSEKVLPLMVGNLAPPPQFAQIEAYWQALRPADGALPRRADFDPRGIADLLHATLLLERIAPGQVRIRLAGMALCDQMGMDLRGMPLSALMVPGARAGLAAQLQQVFDGPMIAHLGLSGEKGVMRPAFDGHLLLLPMRGNSGAADRALGCLVTTGTAGRPPRRFDLTGASLRLVPGLPQTDPARTPAPCLPEVQGLSEPHAPFAAAPKGRPYLRLIKGGA
ncbi:MAG: PAS domain-containing protein [Gemmobacter sp.]|nr:PAS domain-containing protein [Gemmobacter sp.]